MLSEAEARTILENVLSYRTSDEAEASLSGGVESNIRFARNLPTTTGASETISLSYTAVFGRRVGSASTSEMDASGLRSVVERAERLARLAPESPEYMPRLGQQHYLQTPGWDQQAFDLTAEDRARVARGAIESARSNDVMAAGYYSHGGSFSAQANSKGLFAYNRATSVDYTLTMRTNEGNGSGWAAAASHRSAGIEPASLTARALRKALDSRNPAQLDPGTYPVVLEPSCVGDMLQLLYWSLGRRGADEGRSFFSNGENGTKLGQKLFDDRITIWSDPTNAMAPSSPWGDDGLPLSKTTWIEKGVVRNLSVGRYWGEKKGIAPLPFGSNILMDGGEGSVDDLIAATDYGLLVTSFWYIRGVDPRTILHTGLTRDGLFLIEKGKVTRPVVNFRWNESPASVFAKTEMLGQAQRVVTREGYIPTVAPPLKASEFRFTSVSPST